jgi:hypothetical protein
MGVLALEFEEREKGEEGGREVVALGWEEEEEEEEEIVWGLWKWWDFKEWREWGKRWWGWAKQREEVRFQDHNAVTGTQEEEEDRGREWWLTEARGEQRVLKGLFRAVDGEINAAGEAVVKVEERYVYGPPFNMQLY